MYYGEWGLWGRHLFWWLFWIVVIKAMFSLLTPVAAQDTVNEVVGT